MNKTKPSLAHQLSVGVFYGLIVFVFICFVLTYFGLDRHIMGSLYITMISLALFCLFFSVIISCHLYFRKRYEYNNALYVYKKEKKITKLKELYILATLEQSEIGKEFRRLFNVQFHCPVRGELEKIDSEIFLTSKEIKQLVEGEINATEKELSKLVDPSKKANSV